LQPITQSVNKAFTKQSFHFDEQDSKNPVLQRMRRQVYEHVNRYLRSENKMLELNAGTGIDALHFLQRGHRVHAIDISDGMIAQLKKKSATEHLNALTVQQLSYTDLDKIRDRDFDYIFSNFGGLNCIADLREVTTHFASLLKPGSFVTLVIMPVVCPWEIAGIFRNGKSAVRRFNSKGVTAHLEGEYFQTYYHSFGSIKKAFDKNFKFIQSEGLAALSPQPHTPDFAKRYPFLNKILSRLDARVRNYFPFNRWADHIIVTFQFTPKL
jgi:ubiquinone/menaquinone biosynthesis C-methylase UbiE